jgi:hypothetical protein
VKLASAVSYMEYNADGRTGVTDVKGRLRETRYAKHSCYRNLREHFIRKI